MRRKELQLSFSKNEEIKPSEGKLIKSSRPNIDLSGKEALTEEEKLLGLADEILAKKEDVSLGEKTEIIKDYIARNYFEKDFPRTQKGITAPPLFSKEILAKEERGISFKGSHVSKKVRDYFLRMSPQKLESIFGKEELNVVFRVIFEYSDLLKQMEESNLSEDIKKFIIKQNGHEMLPCRILQILYGLNIASTQLRDLFLNRRSMSERKYKESKKKLIQPLKISFSNLNTENKEWQERSKSETETVKTPIEIQGYEVFDFPEIEGKEIIAKALKILPDESYSLSETTIAGSHSQEARHKIQLYPIAPLEKFDKKKRINYLRKLSSVLIQKWVYNLDPREFDQKDLTLQEQLKMIMDWEEVRTREKEWSEIVFAINNLDKKQERLSRSKKSFIESVTYFLNNPTEFQKLCPKRFEFITNLFKKRFPEFNLEKSFSAKEEYDALINTLEQTSE